MENASKALLLAGGLLITLIIISMLVLVTNSLISYQSENSGLSEIDILTAFNNEYESYNREDVRGNELYTLASKVIDYNRRKTASVLKDTDIGDTIGYKPMTLKIDFKKQNKKFSKDVDKNSLIKDSTYVESENTHGLAKLVDEIYELEMAYPTDALYKLATKIDQIFININDYTDQQQQRAAKITAINNFNTCYGSKIFDISNNKDTTINTYWKIIKGSNTFDTKTATGKVISKNRTATVDVYKYYEYVQFKRGIFKCTKMKKDDTGRINELNFEFTGNFK